MRYFITISVPINAESDAEAIRESERLVKSLPDGSAVTGIVQNEWGKTKTRTVKP
jgi:hypothetical protein